MIKTPMFSKTIVPVFLLSTIGTFAQTERGTLVGSVLDLKTNEPLLYASVQLVNTTMGTTTDSKGRFEIHTIPSGTYKVRFSMVGYKQMEVSDVKIQRAVVELHVKLEELFIRMDEILVTPKPESYDASGITARLGKEMVAGTPGSAQDIFWVVQTLPGVTSDGDNSKLYVRGGSPDENLVLYDGSIIRNPFHFDMMGGGYWSIFNSRLIEKVEFYASGFPARYGDRLSSVLLIENRSADFNKVRGEASLSMSDVSGVLEMPLSFANGAALVSARRSYFDAFLKYTDLAGAYDVLPYFFDINSKVDFNLTSNHRLSFSGLFSREKMYGYFNENPHFIGNFSWENKSGVVSGRVRSIWSDLLASDFIISWSKASSSSNQPSNSFENAEKEDVTLKQDFVLTLPSNEIHFGVWIVNEKENVEINLPMEIALNFDEVRLKGNGSSFKPSLYIDNRLKISPEIIANVGLRSDYVSKSNENTISPRINLAYQWNDHMSLSADYGWYYQAPRPFELAINNNLKSKRAESYAIGIKHQVGDAIVISLEAYNKNLSRLITLDSLWNLLNDGRGYSRGIEFFIQLKNPDGFFGWFSYTYSVSKRKEGKSPDLHYFDYDRPHLMSLVMNYSFDENWQAGLRFRYGSGRPFTSTTSAIYDPITNHWKPIPGDHNADRYPAYNRLDLRITRHFLFGSFALDLYLEVINLYNNKNIVHYMWDETYSTKQSFTLLPLLPVLGVRAEFL